MSENTNCLMGFRCPDCGSEGPFRIEGSSVFEVHDDGTEGHEDVNWDGTSNCWCPGCQRAGIVSDFCPEFYGRSDDEGKYLEAARRLHHVDGDLEIDEHNAAVSVSDDGGAYVAMWKWVADEEAGVDRDEKKGGPG